MAAFFLSYRRLDAPDMVGRLHDRIVDRFGPAAVFRDIDSIAVGDDFRERVRKALDECSLLLVVIGPRFLDRTGTTGPDYVVEEIAAAIERSIDIVPVLVHRAEMPTPEQLPVRIRDLAFRQASQVRSDPDFAGDLEKLLRLLSSKNPKSPHDATHPVRVTLHIATFVGSYTACCFINVTNVALADVEITHVWIDSTPPTFPTTSDRPLPKRLQPQESWETWVPLSELPAGTETEQLPRMARARLSTGTVVSSVANDSVPPLGSVPGGPIREIP